MKCENCEETIEAQDPVICVECFRLQLSLDELELIKMRLIREKLLRESLETLAKEWTTQATLNLDEHSLLMHCAATLRALLVSRNSNALERPRIVCLCGSTRFANEFMEVQFNETLAGRIVLSVGCFPRKPDGTWDRMKITDKQKIALDALHLRKIEMADEVYVVNVGGYVGPSTKREIKHAKTLGKPIRWWALHDPHST